jgi:hypothetical protein
MTPQAVADWLARYGRAWEQKDAVAFTDLFTEDATYRWTPFLEPMRGREGIAAAVIGAFNVQQDIHFGWTLLAAAGEPFIAHWTCEFKRIPAGNPVRLDGIFVLRFDGRGLCHDFREWWHSDEPQEATAS